MIHDATVEVTCDGERCSVSIMVSPEYVYRSYSGKDGYYDTSEDALTDKITAEGWTVEDGKHYCEGCRPKD